MKQGHSTEKIVAKLRQMGEATSDRLLKLILEFGGLRETDLPAFSSPLLEPLLMDHPAISGVCESRLLFASNSTVLERDSGIKAA